jgi:Multidrug resistance efflux pump
MPDRKKIVRISVIIIAALVLTVAGFKIYRLIVGTDLVIYGNVDIRTVNLGFRVPGRLISLEVDEGDSIEPGQLLGELDAEPFRNALTQAQGEYNARKANLALLEEGYRNEEVAQVRSAMRERQVAFEYADINLRRMQKLYSTGAISTDEQDNARTARNEALASLQAAKDKLEQYETGSRTQEIEAAQASLDQAAGALAQAQLNLDDTRLLAPSNGVVLTRAIEPGTILSAGNTVFTITLTSPVWVRAYVDEKNLPQAVPGTEVNITTDGQPGKVYKGSIGFVSPTAEFTPKSVQTPELRTDLVYRLRIIVANPDDNLRQGMPVTIEFP